MERTITDRVERWVNQAPGVASIESRSVSGVSVVKLYFQDDIDPSTALTQTNSLMGAAMHTYLRILSRQSHCRSIRPELSRSGY